VTPVGAVILEEGEIAGDKLKHANLRAIVWRCCGCGWGCHTTFKGLRIHQAKAGCGWDSDVSRMTILRTTKPYMVPAHTEEGLQTQPSNHPPLKPGGSPLCHNDGVSHGGASQH